MTNWRKVSTFVPSIRLNPKGANNPAEVEQFKGKYLVGVIEKYEAKPDPKYGKTNNFYQMMVTETSETQAWMYESDSKGGGTYSPVPVKLPEVYSLKASGLLHHLLFKYWKEMPKTYGMLLRITYVGSKEIDVDNPEAFNNPNAPVKIKVLTHQFTVEEDADFVPQLAGPATAAELEHITTSTEPVEEPLPPLPEE